MAVEKVTIVVDGEDKTGKMFGGLRKKLGGLGDMAKNAIGFAMGGALLQIPGMVGNVASSIGDMVNEAAEVEQVAKTFDKLTESIGGTSESLMKGLRDATRGTVADADLMQAANKFIAMGLAETEEEAAQLAEMATQLGMAMGEDATSSMENFALMLANQSIPRLDSFGISSGTVRARIEELMDSTEGLTREQAFMQAVMEQGGQTMEKVGEQGEGNKASMDRLRVTFKNIKDSIGRALLPIFGKLAEQFADLINEYLPDIKKMLEKVSGNFKEWAKDAIPKLIDWIKNELIPAIVDLVAWIKDELVPWIKDELIPWIRDKLVPAIRDFARWVRDDLIPAIKEIIDWFKELKDKLDEGTEAWRNFGDQLRQIWDSIQRIVTEKVRDILNTLAGFWNDIKDAGRNIVDGLKAGIEAGWDAFKSWLRQKVEELFGGLLDFLGVDLFGTPEIGGGTTPGGVAGGGERGSAPREQQPVGEFGAPMGTDMHQIWDNFATHMESTLSDVSDTMDQYYLPVWG